MGARGDGVDGDTPFVLGSVSKSFTALAVAQLVDRGPVRLDADVTDHLPGSVTATPGAVITVRRLLDQTTRPCGGGDACERGASRADRCGARPPATCWAPRRSCSWSSGARAWRCRAALSPRIASGSASDVTALVLVTAAVLVVRAFVTPGWGRPTRSR